MKSPHFILTLFIFAAASPVAFGAGTFTLRTDANGNFVDSDPNFAAPRGLGTASWSGNGTITPNLNGTGTPTIITGTSGGTLSVGNFYMNAGDPKTYWNGDALNTGIALDIAVSVTGTNASFNIGGLNQASAGWRNFSVTNMTNVETLTVTYSFSAPVASMRGTDGFNAPYLVGVRQSAGTGSFNATATIANLTVDGNPFNDIDFPDANFVGSGNISWDRTTQLATIINEPVSANNTLFNFIRALDLDGDGIITTPTDGSVVDGIIQEIERTYATGMTWETEKNGGGDFSDGTAFYFSFNGVQYEDSLTFIPEPSSSILAVLGLCLGLNYRKRPKSRV